MLGFLARTVIAMTLGTVFLIAMLVALAGDAFNGAPHRVAARRRRIQTLQRRNRALAALSEGLAVEEMQS